MTKLALAHSGEVLLDDFLREMDLTQNGHAVAIGAPSRGINIGQGQRRITAGTALPGRYSETSVRFWLNQQTRFDLATEQDQLDSALDAIEPRRNA